MNRVRRVLRDDEGSVLLVGIGFVIVCLLALVVVTDVSSAYLQRRSLMSLADGASLAGAQAVDLDHYYAHGASMGTRLAPGDVVTGARRHLASAIGSRTVTVEQISTDGVNVRVRLSSPLHLPFLAAMYSGVTRVESTSRLDYRPAH